MADGIELAVERFKHPTDTGVVGWECNNRL